MQPVPFRIKICGITRVADALAAVDAGADAIGLNFYPGSPRCLEMPTAEQIVGVLPPHVKKVGVFVNAPPEQVAATAKHLRLDMVQLHGDEPADTLPQFGSQPIMKVLRPAANDLALVTDYLAACEPGGTLPTMVLLDAAAPGQYGGTGQRADWHLAVAYAQTDGCPPLTLAGGLTAENVAEAIRTVRPAAVDTASGVESSPGHKDPAKMQAFVTAAREAFAAFHV